MRRTAAALAVALVLVGAAACSKKEEPRPIIVTGGTISVVNMTGSAWSDVSVWLNDFYRAQASELLPGQRLDVPTSVFTAGWGQRFDPKKQAPYSVEVTARSADGKAVRLTWGRERRR